MNKLKKFMAVLVCMAMTLTLMPGLTVSAATTGGQTDDGLKYKGYDDHVEITDYTGKAAEIEIPDEIEGKPVTSIGDDAFALCHKLTSVTIPDSVTTIGERAFRSCDSLTSVTIPDSVTSIGEGAFEDCDSLTDIIVESNNLYYCDIDGVLFDKDVKTLIQHPIGNPRNTYTIPSSVTSIDDYAFGDCHSLESVIIPDSLTSIGNGAFECCYSLTNVTIPDSVTSIGDYAFESCDSLTSITIPGSVTSIGNYAFEHCYELTNLTIGNGVTSIGDYAFEDCHSLTSITIPGSVTSIGNYAFEHCYELTNLTIGNGVTTIGRSAFKYCDSLTSVTIPDSVTTIGEYAFSHCVGLTSVTIPNGVTSIGDGAFSYCKSLASIIIPGSVTSIDESAFRYCDSLTDIIVDDNNLYYSDIDGVLFDKDAKTLIRYPGNSRRTYTVPGSVTTIGEGAFYGCHGLTSVTIPDGVTSIASFAFEDCNSLTSITIGNGVTSIDYCAFRFCDSLTSVTIPDGVTSIGESAFSYCHSLTSVTIPDSVTVIGYEAFRSCHSFTDIYYGGSKADWGNIDIRNRAIPDGVTIHYDYVGPNKPAEVSIVSTEPSQNSIVDMWTDSILTFEIAFSDQIELEEGKTHTAYIKNYWTDETVLTPEIGLTEDTKKISFYAGRNELLMDCKYYIVIDKNAHLIYDRETIEPITGKEQWTFSTAYGLNLNTDVLKFTNSIASFFGDNSFDFNEKKFYTKRNTYPISSPELEKKIIDVIGKSDYKMATKKKDKYIGACFGMSLSTTLYNVGRLNPALFDNKEAGTLHDLPSPIDSTGDYGVRDMVNYYHLLQFALTDGLNTIDLWRAHTFPWSEKSVREEALATLVGDAMNIQNSKIPFLLVMGEGETGHLCTHAVVVTGARDSQDDGYYQLLIWDPNWPTGLSTINVSYNYSSITFDGQEIYLLKSIDVTKIDSNQLILTDSSQANEISAKALSLEDNNSIDTVRVVALGNFTIENSDGQKLIYSNGMLSGDMEIIDVDFLDSGEDNLVEYVFKVNSSEGYSFSSDNDRSICTIKNGESYTRVDVVNSSDIKINKNKGVTVSGSNIDYNIYTTTATNDNMFSLCGTTNENIVVGLNEDGSANISADDLSNVSFESMYEDTNLVFDSETNSAEITTSEDNGLSLNGVKIHDDSTFTIDLMDDSAAHIKNNTGEDKSGIVIIAEYDSDGALANVKTTEIFLNSKEDLVLQLNDVKDKYKIFIWDSLTGMKPLSNVI